MKKFILLAFLSVASWSSMAAPVNVNQADAATINAALKGIGMAKAQAIVAYREEHGAFNSADDLTKVKGIGSRTVEINRDDILVSDAEVKN